MATILHGGDLVRREGGPPGGHGGHGHAPPALGPAAAARARDVSRPTEEQVADAERTVVLRHRGPEGERATRPSRKARPDQGAEPSSDPS